MSYTRDSWPLFPKARLLSQTPSPSLTLTLSSSCRSAQVSIPSRKLLWCPTWLSACPLCFHHRTGTHLALLLFLFSVCLSCRLGVQETVFHQSFYSTTTCGQEEAFSKRWLHEWDLTKALSVGMISPIQQPRELGGPLPCPRSRLKASQLGFEPNVLTAMEMLFPPNPGLWRPSL